MKAKSVLVDEAPRTEIPERGVSIGLVNAALGAKNVEMHINVLYPNTSGPYHFHAASENVYYVLMGRHLRRGSLSQDPRHSTTTDGR